MSYPLTMMEVWRAEQGVDSVERHGGCHGCACGVGGAQARAAADCHRVRIRLRDQADACLDGLERTARTGSHARRQEGALRRRVRRASPRPCRRRPHQPAGAHCPAKWACVAEVACALTVSERTAAALLAQSCELTTTLPLTLAALEEGSMSWQHARIMVDETPSLDRRARRRWRPISWTRTLRTAARRCPAGDMAPSRFRAKARDLAGTPPPGQHRKAPRQGCRWTGG